MEQEEKVVEEEIECEPLTFDEILQDKMYQSEFDKRVSKALDTAKVKWQQELETQKSEAEKLAKMNADERHKFEMDKVLEEKNNAIQELNAYKLKETAVGIAKEKGIDLDLLSLINFNTENADSIKEKIDTLGSVYSKSVENTLNKILQEKAPKQVNQPQTSKEEDYLREKYKNNPYFKG